MQCVLGELSQEETAAPRCMHVLPCSHLTNDYPNMKLVSRRVFTEFAWELTEILLIMCKMDTSISRTLENILNMFFHWHLYGFPVTCNIKRDIFIITCSTVTCLLFLKSCPCDGTKYSAR